MKKCNICKKSKPNFFYKKERKLVEVVNVHGETISSDYW